jgi:hypothetical protein
MNSAERFAATAAVVMGCAQATAALRWPAMACHRILHRCRDDGAHGGQRQLHTEGQAMRTRTLLLVALLALLAACSKTVTWEEEVPLNTGETIWVQRSMPWVYKGGMGNPFDMAMRATGEQTIRFKYRDKEYIFTGVSQVLWIAIAPSGQPSLVADPVFSGWNYQYETAYYCVIPYYVQFVPDITGKKWTWPEKIEPWLYGLQANLMVVVPQLSEKRKGRYTKQDRDERDARYRREAPNKYHINPSHDGNGDCPKKYDPSMKQKSE